MLENMLNEHEYADLLETLSKSVNYKMVKTGL